MEKKILIAFLFAGILLFGCTAEQPAVPEEKNNQSGGQEGPQMVGNDTDEHGCKGSAGYVWCESLQKCIRPWETECPKTIEDVAQEFCGGENVASVAICGEHIRVMSSLTGGGTTLYNKTGGEIATCPVVAPDAMSETCKEYLLENNCAEQKIC